jgi:hypothetical protein
VDGVKEWVKRTENSPYHVNLYQADTELNQKIQNVRSEFKRLSSAYERMDGMVGKPKEEVVHKDVLKRASSPAAKVLP